MSNYHSFRWYLTLEKKHPRKRFQNFRQSCVLLTDRIESHQCYLLSFSTSRYRVVIGGFRSDLSIINTQDWRKFWKGFRGRFVFQSRVSTKTVVRDGAIPVSTDKYIFTRSVKWENFTWRELNQTVSLISDKHINAISRRKFKQIPLLDYTIRFGVFQTFVSLTGSAISRLTKLPSAEVQFVSLRALENTRQRTFRNLSFNMM